jgi:hypothetical protein
MYERSNQLSGTAYGTGMVSPAPVDSASPIRDGVSQAEQLLSEIHDAIDALEKRLDTVLTPGPPTGASAAPPKNQPVASHVQGRLSILNEGFSHAASRLRDVYRRVEV